MSNWSELSCDLLVEIAERIKKLEDFFAFGAVCKGWCAVRKKEYFKGLWLRQETPYLLLPIREDDKDDNAREFYSLIEGEIVASVRIPKFKGRKCHESLGWLLAVENDGSMCLLDPFSSVEIPLPHQTTFPDYESYEMDEYVFVRKFTLSARPSETSDFIVMIICGGYGHLAYWRPGDESWTRIKNRDGGPYLDVMYYGGHFYTVDNKGYARVFTLERDTLPECRTFTRLVAHVTNNLHVKNNIDLVYNDTLYILKTSRSLFVISRTAAWWSIGKERMFYNTSAFQVYEVDTSTCTWKVIKTVGNMAIFVGHNSTFAIDTSGMFGKIKSNHIYYTDDGWECYHFHEKEGGGKDMGAYNIETATLEPSFYSGEMLLTKVCPFIWIAPSF